MKNIRNLLSALVLGILIVAGVSCSSDASEELPSVVSQFTTQYFPGQRVKSYQELSDGGCIVQLSGGPTIRFDSDYRWSEVAGEGARLPQVLMYDQLPMDLYDYLQGTEQQSDVYALKRDHDYYTLKMLDTVLTYDINTGKVTYPGMSTAE